MSVPSKGHEHQRVQIPSGEGLAPRPERTTTVDRQRFRPKLVRRMKRAAMRMKAFSPEMPVIEEADPLHGWGRRRRRVRFWRGHVSSSGVSGCSTLQDGVRVNSGDPCQPSIWRYCPTSRQTRGRWNAVREVGLAHSTPRAGKPRTWGRGEQGHTLTVTVGLHDTQRSR